MNSIKKTQMAFKITTLFSILILILTMYKISVFNSEQRLLQYMPMGQYKVMTQNNISKVDNIIIEEYKVIINPDSVENDIVSVSEMIVELSKEVKKYNGLLIKFYGSVKDLNEDNILAKVVYAPNGKLDESLKGIDVGYNRYTYSFEFVAKHLEEVVEGSQIP